MHGYNYVILPNKCDQLILYLIFFSIKHAMPTVDNPFILEGFRGIDLFVTLFELFVLTKYLVPEVLLEKLTTALES